MDRDARGALLFQHDRGALAERPVRHAAAAPAVDVRAGDPKAVVFSAVENTLSNAGEGTADLPVDTYNVDVVLSSDDTTTAFGPADIAVEDGVSLIVYAVGQASDGLPLPILTETISGLGENPSGVPTGNSPIDSGTSLLPLLAIAAIAAIAVGGFTAARKNG